MKPEIRRFLLSCLAVCSLMAAGTAYAQPDEAARKELDQFIADFSRDYVNLPQSKNKQSFLKYFAPDATSNLYIFNLSGKGRVQNSDRNGLETYLDNILRSPSIYIGYEVTDKSVTYASQTIGVVVYRVNFEIKEETGIWVKGNETVTLALEKRAGLWQVVHYTVMQVEDEKLKGTCLCELFVSEVADGEVVAKTTIPSGRSYSTRFDNFDFRTVGADVIIRVGTASFRQMKSGALLAQEGGEERQIGIAVGKKEAVLAIIKDYLYKDSCTRLKVAEK
ncbi:MAG: hypothetical protein NW241_06280 [Bacteroidia bacterium]|nr:hypothetical protein [Bacteroidia bacterium]